MTPRRELGAGHVSGVPRRWSRGDFLLALVLWLAVNVAYIPVWHAGFTWDDDYYITDNRALLSWHGLGQIWTTSQADISPLATTTFWVLHALWGTEPLAYHLANVLLHAACGVVLWRVLLGLRVPGAWFGAALWALHPVEVESVAWASELKNPESALFYLLSILFFLRWLGPERAVKSGRDWNYGLSLLFAALAMACKSSTIVLPAVLCLCGWWLDGRWRWRNLVAVAPMAVFSFLAAVSSLLFEQGQFGLIAEKDWNRTWPERLVTAGDAVWFYLGKLAWPHPLMTIYPREPVAADRWTSYLPLAAAVVALLVLWMLRQTPLRPVFFAYAYFLIVIGPVLGLAENTIFRYAWVFDHLQYLASMGPVAAAGAGLTQVARTLLRRRSELRHALAVAVLLGLGIASWARAGVYETSRKLWADAQAKNPNSYMTNDSLGFLILEDGDPVTAMRYQHRALELSPDSPVLHEHLGDSLLTLGRLDEALAEYRRMVNLHPMFDAGYSDIGYIYLEQGKVDAAVNMILTALSIGPGRAESHERLGEAYEAKKQFGKAIFEYRVALRLMPGLFAAHKNLGLLLAQSGKPDEAVREFRAAAALEPDQDDVMNNLGNVLASLGRMDEAIAAYERARAIDPKEPRTLNNLGAAYFRVGRLDDAEAQFAREVEIEPNNDMAHYALGLVEARRGDAAKAQAEFQRALAINPNNALARARLTGAPPAGNR